ncbi:hypothetical protein CRG98_001975 [Punica granatum]|uniref:Uncharacterized protein n=1 Tax=Punica granatum TaxID=22663 RepID=A0A2I0LAC5_PUNGR|nr:hypothetical protein CRG98_001975 [Punica granatum]
MHEGKSRGSGLGSRKTRLVVPGDGYPRAATAVAWEDRARHASSDHGTYRTCQTLDKPETMRESSVNKMDPVKKERVERQLCTVVWLSDRDHLFTGESEGDEGPFERDGTTRQSCGRKWHVVEVECTRRWSRDPMVLAAGKWCWGPRIKNLSSEMNLGGEKYVGYEVWLCLA